MPFKPYNPGELRHAIALQSPTLADDDAGGRIASYATVATVHAAIEPIQAGRGGMRDAIIYGANRDEPAYRIVIRYRADITSRWRILWVKSGITHVYEIKGAPVNIESRSRYLEIMVMEIMEQDAQAVV